MIKLMVIFLGGGIGSVARFGLSRFTGQYLGSSFPFGTLAVNVASCIFLGLILGLTSEKYLVNPAIRLFFIVGFCGGFSTFSTFTFETMELLRLGQVSYAIANILLNLLLCIGSLAGGIYISKYF